MIGILDDSITDTSSHGSCARRASAVSQPAVPPPTMPTVRTPSAGGVLGREASRTRSSWLLKSSSITGFVNWMSDTDPMPGVSTLVQPSRRIVFAPARHRGFRLCCAHEARHAAWLAGDLGHPLYEPEVRRCRRSQ